MSAPENVEGFQRAFGENAKMWANKQEYEKVTSKTIVVIGANRGLGLEAVKQLAGMSGNQLVVTARQSSAGEETVNLLKNINTKNNYKSIQLDLTDDKSIEHFVSKLDKKSVDSFLINSGALFKEETQENFDKTIEVNVFGVIKLLEKSIPYVKQGGRMIVVSSILGWDCCTSPEYVKLINKVTSIQDPIFRSKAPFYSGNYIMLSYNTSKAIIDKYIQLASKEQMYRSPNIQLTAVHPNYCRTDLGGKGNNSEAPLSGEEGAQSLVWSITSSKDLNGQFYSHGNLMSWTGA